MATTNEDVRDALTAQDIINRRVIGSIENTVNRRIRRLTRDLKALLDRIDPGGAIQNAARRRRTIRFNEASRDLIRRAFSDINQMVRQDLRRIARTEATGTGRAVNAALSADLLAVAEAVQVSVTASLTAGLATQTLIEGSVMAEHWRRIGQRTQRAIMDQLREGIRDGQSNAQIVTRIVGGTVEGVAVPGVMRTSRRNARALVNTGVNAVLNASRLATLQASDDVVKALQQVSTLDGRTSEICIAHSGQVWDINTLEPIPPSVLPFNGGPPRHFNCRSTLVPVLRSFRELGIDADELAPSTRASMDGQVAETITFDAFLRGKSRAFQNELLGPGKARLWRGHRISLTQLVDMRGNPMTLGQLEAKLGIGG